MSSTDPAVPELVSFSVTRSGTVQQISAEWTCRAGDEEWAKQQSFVVAIRNEGPEGDWAEWRRGAGPFHLIESRSFHRPDEVFECRVSVDAIPRIWSETRTASLGRPWLATSSGSKWIDGSEAILTSTSSLAGIDRDNLSRRVAGDDEVVEVSIASATVEKGQASTRALRVVWTQKGRSTPAQVLSYVVAVRPEGPTQVWTYFRTSGLEMEIDAATVTQGARAEHFEVCVRVADELHNAPWSNVLSTRPSVANDQDTADQRGENGKQLALIRASGAMRDLLDQVEGDQSQRRSRTRDEESEKAERAAFLREQAANQRADQAEMRHLETERRGNELRESLREATARIDQLSAQRDRAARRLAS